MQDRFYATIAKRALQGPYSYSEVTKSLVTSYGHVEWSNGDMLHSVCVQRYTLIAGTSIGYWQDIHLSSYRYIRNADSIALKLCNKYVHDAKVRVIMNGTVIQGYRGMFRP